MAHQDGAQPGAALQPRERLDQSPFQLQRHCPTGLPMAEYEPGSGIFYKTEVRAEGEGYLLLEFPEAEGVAARGVVRLDRRKQELLSHTLAALFSEEHPSTAGRPDV